MSVLLGLLRVHQWVKNLFILFPLIFSGQFYDTDQLAKAVLTLVAFCCVSSSIYILNDYRDIEQDRVHPKKKLRPLASGAIALTPALVIALILVVIGISLGVWIGQGIFELIIVYIILHLLYNLVVKNIVILDVFFIAFGFLLRVWAGSLAVGVLPSQWLQLCVFVLSLFLGFSKRRVELSSLKEKAGEHRLALMEYNLYLLDQLVLVCSVLAIVFYGLYTFSAEAGGLLGNGVMLYSIGFVIFGIFRYLYLIHMRKLGDEPGELILKDIPLLFNIMLWVIYVVWVFYGR